MPALAGFGVLKPWVARCFDTLRGASLVVGMIVLSMELTIL